LSEPDYIYKTCGGCGRPCRLNFDNIRAVLAPNVDAKALRKQYEAADVVYCKTCYPSNWEVVEE